MKRIFTALVLSLSVLNYGSAQETDYFCKKIIEQKAKRLDIRTLFFIPLWPIGVGIPIVLSRFERSRRHTLMGNTLANASLTQDKILERFDDLMREEYNPSDRKSLQAALKRYNLKRANLKVEPMSLKEFEDFYYENYILFIEGLPGDESIVKTIRNKRKEIKNGWPYTNVAELINKKAKTDLTAEEIKSFMRENQYTDYFCPYGKALKMSKKSLKKIARDIKNRIN